MIIPFETGIPSLLKEKGFDEPCYAFYYENKLNRTSQTTTKNEDDCIISAPDYNQVLDWFDEKHGIKLWVSFDEPIDLWYFSLSGGFISFSEFDTRYEALDEGIIEAIKLIK